MSVPDLDETIGNSVLRHLQAIPGFDQLAPELLARVTACAVTVRLPAEHSIFEQGQSPEHLYVVLGGEVGLTGLDDGGEETVVEILRSGAVFIEAPVLMAQPYLMGAKTLCPTTLLLPAQKLRDDVAEHPPLSAAMLALLSAHFRVMVTEIKDLKLKSASQRLAVYLLGLCGQREGTTRILLPHSKGLIAARIGIRRETLSRALNALKDVGVVALGPRIWIGDIARLRDFCAG